MAPLSLEQILIVQLFPPVCIDIAVVGFHWALVGCHTFNEINYLSAVLHWMIICWQEFNASLAQAENSHI